MVESMSKLSLTMGILQIHLVRTSDFSQHHFDLNTPEERRVGKFANLKDHFDFDKYFERNSNVTCKYPFEVSRQYETRFSFDLTGKVRHSTLVDLSLSYFSDYCYEIEEIQQFLTSRTESIELELAQQVHFFLSLWTVYMLHAVD